MGVPGEDEYRNKGVAYCPHCDGPLFKGKRVAVIGGGNSGVEAAIDLAGIVAHVTLIEFDSQLRADAVLQAKLRSLPNVTIIVSALSTEVLGDGEKVTACAIAIATPRRSTLSIWTASSCRSVSCPIASGSKAILPSRRAARSRSMRAGRHRFQACSRPATRRPRPTSRSSSRWGAAQPPRYRPSII
jgi:hypothetical protein